MPSWGRLCAYVLGILTTLLFHGVLQERVMTQLYDGEYFRFSIFLVLCNRIVAVLFASATTAVRDESLHPKAPLWTYALISLSNVLASTCQYECLKYVSFTASMIGKSCKLIPVMCMGVMVSGNKYSCRDWLTAAAVTAGISMFMLFGPTEANTPHQSTALGLLLLAAFLVFDGLTSVIEERLFKKYNMSMWNQMVYVNFFSAITAAVALVCLRQLSPALQFALHHRDFVTDASLMSMASAASQCFIFGQIQEFGALIFALTINLRQVASITLSYHIFAHPVCKLQILGIATVFLALFAGRSFPHLESMWQFETLALEKSGEENEATYLLQGKLASDSEPEPADGLKC